MNLNSQMIKLEQYDCEDLELIDPHVIQPLLGRENILSLQPTLDDLVCCDQKSASEVFSEDESSPPPISENSDIKMEQCISLDLYLSPITGTSLITDELNTPVFGEFFAPPIQQQPIKPTTAEATTKEPTIVTNDVNPFYFPTKQQPKRDETNAINCHETNSVIVTSDLNDSSLLSPNNNDILMDGVNLEEYDFLSDCNDVAMLNDFSDVIIEPANGMEFIKMETPENSNCSTDSHHNYALKLNLDDNKFNPDVLQTPDVINTIYSIEKDFNLFTYIEAEVVNPETIIPIPTTSDQDDLPKKRKRKTYDDDDEDYVPPSPKAKRRVAARISSDESDSELEEERPAKIKKRGRPSKTLSVSSEHSESSKYREMRDKNNEASRRSRQKRRHQELNCEQEKDGLMDRNIKLKAKVAELEKTVDKFRTNLMQLLLNK